MSRTQSLSYRRAKMPAAQRARRAARRTLLYLCMSLLALVMVFPFYYSIVNSMRFKYDADMNPTRLWPEQFTLKNYQVFAELLVKRGVSLGPVMWNTAFITFSIIVLSVFFCSLAAYSLARLNYKGKAIIVKIFFASMMIPGVVSLVPSYQLLHQFHLTNSKWGLIIPGTVSIYGILFLRAFFLATPKEVAEAARIDGAGELHIFVGFYLRMVLPGVITLALFTFNANWNSFMWPRVVLGTNKADWVLAIVIRDFQSAADPNELGPGPLMAAAIITIIPTVTFFLAGQRFFMDNLAFTGIK